MKVVREVDFPSYYYLIDPLIWVVLFLICCSVFCSMGLCCCCCKSRLRRWMLSFDRRRTGEKGPLTGSGTPSKGRVNYGHEMSSKNDWSAHNDDDDDDSSPSRLSKCLVVFVVLLICVVLSYFLSVVVTCIIVPILQDMLTFANFACAATIANLTVTAPVASVNETGAKTRPASVCDYNYTMLSRDDIFVRLRADDELGDNSAAYFNVWRLDGNSNGSLAHLDATLVYHSGSGTQINYYANFYRMLTAMGIRVFTYDYPGYGRSEGVASEDAIYASARKVTAMAMTEGPKALVHWGFSMGGSVAALMAKEGRALEKANASTTPRVGLALYNSIDSMPTRVDEILMLTGWAAKHVITNQLDTLENGLEDFDGCLLFVYSTLDTWVPMQAELDMLERAESFDKRCSIVYESVDCTHDCDPLEVVGVKSSFQQYLQKLTSL